MRELIILGTASQVPTRTRNHNGYLLLWDGQGVLFDPGEGTQRQLTFAGVASSRITRICLTHVHGDHCLGLPGVLARMTLDGVEHPVHLHYPASGDTMVRHLVAAANAHLDLRLRPHGGGLIAEGLTACPLRHRIETYGYRVEEPPGRTMLPERLAAAGIAGPEIGRLQREGHLRRVLLEDMSETRPGQSFAIVMDTAPCPGAEELAAGVDLLLVESTFADEELALAEAYLHLTAGGAGSLASTVDARRLILTHFSSRYPDVGPLLRQAKSRAGSIPVAAASDLDRYSLPRRRERTEPRERRTP